MLAVLYALGLILAPHRIISLLSALPLNPVATDLARLFGAALVLITLVAWGASRLADPAARRMIAGGLFIYATLGTIITSWDSLRVRGVRGAGAASSPI